MGISSLRSLLLAAIVLSNCITWTASRHHYTHNVNGHRSRHRRQGANLFLPASYVIPGGEGSGPWGEWGDVSPCSRTCGGGVASQKRICLAVGSDGPPCTGGDTKYFSCQTQDCPEGSGDFRSEQCAEFNDKLFRDNNRYSWIPYTKAQNPCELNCMPKGERFYYRQRLKVVDGTRCNDESFDVCVNGTCQAVGCDMMLGSNAREDKCRVCRGNGTNCRTMEGLIDDPELRRGYNDVLLIPQGATNIFIEEIRDSSNYLALRAKEQSKYYLNGEYHIDFPRSLVIAGALWHYERSQQGFAAPDKLRCIGPTNEPLYLSLLLQEDNVGVKYEYSIPSDLAPRPTQQYGWVFDQFTPCSATCGGGFQMRKVSCRSREELEEVDESLCDEALKPATNQTCNIQPCSARWVEGPWSPCSKPCGEGGIRSRQVHCEKIQTDGVTLGLRARVPDSECFDLLGAQPKLYEECNQNATCPTWFTGPWKPCDKLCGEGKQTRQVVCHTKVKGRVQVFDDHECGEEKPPSEQPCNLHPCGGIDWVLSDWTGCDSCLSKTRTRIAKCATADREVVKFELCAYHPAPILEEPCDLTKLPPCEVQWYATQWSSCSVECGKGVQTRHVFCGMFDGTSVTKVDDAKCDQQTKYKDTKPCEVPKEKCPAKWYAGPWSECSKKCGGGEQKRQVMCLIDEKVVGTCDQESTPDSLQTCNVGPCNEDEILPVDSKSTPIMDSDYDYDGEECEEEAYDEVGAEEDEDLSLNYPEEKMYSDSPAMIEGSGEYESLFTTDSGSGSEPTDITIEGSGTTFDETTESESSGSTASWETTESTVTMETSSTDSESTEETGSTETASTATEVTSSDTESSSTGSSKTETDITESTVTDATDETSTGNSASTETSVTGSTESTVTDATKDASTESSASTETSLTGSTESTVTDSTETLVTGSSETTETGSTISTEIDTTETGSTETDVTGSTESSETAETSSTDSTVTDVTETTETASTEPTETTITESVDTDTTEISVTTESLTDSSTSESSTVSGSTDSSETTESTTEVSTESSSTSGTDTEGTISTTVSSESTSESGTTISSIEDTMVTESSTSEGSTEESSTTESGATTEITSSTKESTSGSDTTESESSTSAETEVTLTTESGSTETTESSATSDTESTVTEETASTPTDTTESTETSVTESTGSTEMSSTEATETTLTGLSTTEMSTEESTAFSSISTSESWASTIQGIRKKPKCRRRKIAKCLRSKFGCCSDKKTPATGPFDKGCPTPKTCKETKFGCCDDGVSPATGAEKKGCPVVNCKETLYGCCLSDNVTPAEGNDQEGCPKPRPACEKSKYGCCKDGETKAKGPKKKGCPETETKKPETKPKGCEASKFGCCADNKTEATGPDGAGCSCNTTKFGCCPDGVSPASSADMEGCVTSCTASEHGCCQDGKTPAHGPDFEGCCLQSPFGCCPDNYKPADGPHMEGCECQHARYGCCPDNITIARGPYNEGCGCKHSQFGCCPDRHTEAKGPNFEGCDCSTHQFGCCADGVTAAKGPGQQGCHCQQTQFGCCGDGKTAAEGPDQLGCNCASSRFGCCPDGVTEAKGEKFLNCTDVPENRQAACSLATDRGPCRNFTVYWFYDMTYGGCSRFWYGGCEGNGNRFSSKEECDDVCVQPNPKDTCKLPKVKGPCNNRHLRWHYDSNREQCMQFEFGGCLGNANNFESRELCQKQCEPDKTEDQCTLPIERGPCAGNFGRWGYDQESGRCEQFIWGGCEGNSNRFSSKAACLQRCNPPGVQKPECSQPQESGNCTDKLALWSFSAVENRCLPFYYSGCGGNDNRFDSEAACAENCPSAYVQETCALPALTGECADYTLRWFFDTSENRCRQFYYGGCGGNENNFVTEEQCTRSCSEQQLTTTTPSPVNVEPDACQLPALPGPCGDWSLQWFYNTSIDTCQQFYYGGCEGNDNRFESQQACERRCKKTDEPAAPATTTTRRTTRVYTAPTTPTTPVPTTTSGSPSNKIPPGCQTVSGTREECVEAGKVWYLDLNQGVCVSHENAASGTNCVRQGAYSSQEACERACGAFNGLDVCRYEVDAGPCNEVQAKVYFDAARGACEPFVYGGCHGGPNRFSSVQECEDVCKPQTDPCKQPSESGNCLGYLIKWYFDELRNDCGQFVYTGCGGNDNRFETREECLGRCVTRDTTTIRVATVAPPATTTTTTPAPVPPPVLQGDEECRTPTSLEPCGENMTIYYYDTRTGACLSGDFGGCRYANRYSSEEECERRCGAFRNVDVCRAQLDPGPCSQSVPKVYWDARSGRCLQFAYGGCHGGPNRFSSVQECEDVCGDTGPVDGDNAVLPECERFNEECQTLRCDYGVERAQTAYGCERCICSPAPVDRCDGFRAQCESLQCPVERTVDADGCERCQCLGDPCVGLVCPAGERCKATLYQNPVTGDPEYLTECRAVNKSGSCPYDDDETREECERECNDDADCGGVGKCCLRGCSALCLPPAAPTTTRAPLTTTTYLPDVPLAPQANVETQPEVSVAEGGKATLRCLFHGNPPPSITWRRGEITIESDMDRYRLLSDGALEIVSIYRNDSGVYICIGNNALGSATQEIRLEVNDPEEGSAGIAGAANAAVSGALGRPVNIRCLAFGYPPPSIYWYRGRNGPMVPYSSALYEARGNVLQIRSLTLETAGEYICQAYNGIGKPAEWAVTVQIQRPHSLTDYPWTVTGTPTTERDTTTSHAPVFEYSVFTVPVTTSITLERTTVAAGAELSIPCAVDGYPFPQVYWTKDSVRLVPSDRMMLTDARLTISGANINDSGEYGCHASNAFSSHTSTVQITVEGLYIPPKCTDNPFFANCALIVRSKYCKHQYYSRFCCKSCVEAGQLNPLELDMQADEAWRKRK